MKTEALHAGEDAVGTLCNDGLGVCQIVPGTDGALTSCIGCGYVGRPCCPFAEENSVCGLKPTSGPDLYFASCKADPANNDVLTCTECDLSQAPGNKFRKCCPGTRSYTVFLARRGISQVMLNEFVYEKDEPFLMNYTH